MDRNIYLLIAFDGGAFHGWQRQPGMRTVQALLEDAVVRVVRHPTYLIASGRTDAGVHAAGLVANFATTSGLPAMRMRHAIGSRMADDVAILAAHDVSTAFHATRSAVCKLYRYRIHASRRRPVERLDQRRAYHVWGQLDLDAMRAAARHMVGTMDFTSMAATRCQRESMVRRVIRCHIERHFDEVRIDVEGEGFLQYQVRNMVGTLLEVGRGAWEPDRVATIIESRDRTQAGPTAPAHGLTLQWVRYPAELMRPMPCETAQQGNQRQADGDPA